MNFRLFLFLILVIPFPAFGQTPGAARLSQNQSAKPAMTKDDVLQMATLLMAIKKKYSMINLDPASDFLVFNNEDRDELDFYPKKTLPEQMENLGLIQGRKEVLDPYTRYEADPKTGGWTAITNPPATYYNYRVTAKGNEFLRNAPKTLGHPLPPLKLASDSSVLDHLRVKPIKVVTYDQEAIQKIRDDFVRIALNQVEVLFSPAKSDKPESELPEGFSCGPNLWAKIETEAIKNGVHPGVLKAVYSYWRDTGDSGSFNIDRPGKGISSRAQVSLFRKTLFQVFPSAVTPYIRKLSESESSRYQDLQDMALGVSPFLMRSVAFFVEYDQLRFLVKVRNETTEDFLKISPKVSLIELIEHP